jgi:hypothetical protein
MDEAMLRARVEGLLSSWRMPQLLLRMFVIQSEDEDATQLLRTLMKALLSADPDTDLRKLRYVGVCVRVYDACVCVNAYPHGGKRNAEA